jgi:CRP-like cAMP-binding protein
MYVRQTMIKLQPQRYVRGNHLLDALPLPDRAGLERDVELLTLPSRAPTQGSDGGTGFVDFPIDAVLSVVVTFENGDTIEVNSIGHESFVESEAALDSGFAQRVSLCQVAGNVARMPMHRFEERMNASPSFAQFMRRNVRARLFSAQQFAACNARHSILQRCARWLSMTQDRVGNDTFTLTHESLAITLGVRRPSVSEAAEALQARGAIAYRRGVLTVLDSALLHSFACECYAACKSAFAASLHEPDYTTVRPLRPERRVS